MEKFIIIVVAVILISWIIKTRNTFKALLEDIKHAGSEISVYQQKREDSLNDALSIAKISYSKEVEGVELMYLGQKFPKLQATESYALAVQNAFSLQDEITACRTTLNGNISEYNKMINAFPRILVAKLFGYKQEKVIDEENLAAHRHLDKRGVDFSQF